MILALGELQYQAALPFLWELTKLDTPHTIIHMALGDAIVRLSSKGKSDVESVFQIANTKDPSLINGAFNAMSELRLVPNDDEIGRILSSPDTRLCRDHAIEIDKYGGEFSTTATQERTSKSGSLKLNNLHHPQTQRRSRPLPPRRLSKSQRKLTNRTVESLLVLIPSTKRCSVPCPPKSVGGNIGIYGHQPNAASN